jgi:hypothetical protein
LNTSLNELLRLLSESEREQVNRAVSRLFANEDFQLVFRKMNADCGGVLGSSFLPSNGGDAVKAAGVDGSKGPVRWLFDTYLSSLIEEKTKPTEQVTK